MGMGSISLDDLGDYDRTAPFGDAVVPGYATAMARGADSGPYHTFEEIEHNSGIADAGNNAVAGRRINNMRSMIEIPAVAPTDAPGSMFVFKPGTAGVVGQTVTKPLNLPVPIGYEVS